MKRITAFVKDSQGSIIAFTALFLFVAVGLLAVVVDLGHVQAVRVELAAAADSGALAGARALYPNLDPALNLDADCVGAKARALAAINANYADKAKVLAVGEDDIQVGTWDITQTPAAANFVPGCTADANAVKVRIYKSETFNNPVIMGFAQFIYGPNIAIWAEAIAWVGNAVSVGEGCTLPVGIPHCSGNEYLACPYLVEFTPDNGDNTAWHTFTTPNANANCLKHMVANCVMNCPNDPVVDPTSLTTCNPQQPDVTPAQISVNNGEINSALQEVWDKFQEVVAVDGDDRVDNPFYSAQKPTDPSDPNYNSWSPYPYAWLTQILLLSCGEGPCGEEPGTITDWKAVQTLHLRGVKCFKVTDVMAAGKKDPFGRKAAGAKYIRGCIVPDAECTITAQPGTGPNPPSNLPKLVWTDSNYIAPN